MKIKVSVIVPVYNVEKFIDKCLNSLVNQTLKEIEIIVVNDGSPDNSQKIIDKYVKKYPEKVQSFIKENGGQGSARNIGIVKAKGEYISFVDSDDWLDLDALEKMYSLAKKDNTDKISNISEGFYHCNCGHESTMNNNNSKKNLDMIIIMDDIINYLKENKKYDENIVSYLIFDHILITTINRLALQKSKDKKETINIFLKYCKDNISGYTKMPFYNEISRNRKIIAWLNYHDLYNVSKIILLLKGKMKG